MAEGFSLSREGNPTKTVDCSIGALTIRIGFWGPFAYKCNQEPPKPNSNFLGPYSILSSIQHARREVWSQSYSTTQCHNARACRKPAWPEQRQDMSFQLDECSTRPAVKIKSKGQVSGNTTSACVSCRTACDEGVDRGARENQLLRDGHASSSLPSASERRGGAWIPGFRLPFSPFCDCTAYFW